MSKVISFSISDRYLDKLRTLYPALTDNLAAKQFITDGLESSLGSSLDDSLDEGLDGKLKSLIESRLDGILEGRLDATVGKLISSLSERMARLEEKLDTNLDGRLDDMEPLLKREREASIATSPLPPSPPDRPAISEPVQPAIGPVGMNAVGAAKYLKAKKVKVSYDSLNRWINNEKIPDSPQGKDVRKHLTLRDKLYYPIN